MIAVTSALLVAMLLVAAPAGADHVAEISADGSRCKIGKFANTSGGLGFDLLTDRTTIEVDPATGDLVYTCHFDVPSHVPVAERTFPFLLTGEDWHLPSRAIKFGGFVCWPPGAFLPRLEFQTVDSQMIVTPSGNGIMTCTFPAFAPPADAS